MPTQSQLILPLLLAAHDSGGRISSKDAYDALARAHALSEEVRAETVVVECGQKHNLWERHVRFANQRAKAAGYMTASERGQWELTDAGREALQRAESAVSVRIITDAENNPLGAQVELCVGLPTIHTLHCGDARDMRWIPNDSIPLIVTSVPFFDLKSYDPVPGQLGDIHNYEEFLDMMSDALRECFRVMMPGARCALNVSDVLKSRKQHGKGGHMVYPLSADLRVGCRKVGFNCLTGIIWQKFSNCKYEEGGAGVLGQPGMPRMCIKSETESILMFRKPGPYFSATPEQREASRISKENWKKWVRPVWNDVSGAKAAKGGHPAPWPVELPLRLIQMLSYTGPIPHTVLDPFSGEFRTSIAAMRTNRNSIGIDISPRYVRDGLVRLQDEARRLANPNNN